MRCPGQDRRYWTEDAVFEVPCPECGKPVEFFKDESSGRCRNCDHRFRNPGIDFGCAQWCAMAEQCLGLAPDESAPAEGTQGALAGRLIQEVSQVFTAKPARLARSLKAFHYAKELLVREPADPRTVLAAVLLFDVFTGAGADVPADSAGQPEKAAQILQDLGVEASVVARVCEILACCAAGGDLDCVEFRLVRDAHALNTLASQAISRDPRELADAIQSQLSTEAAKNWAGKWLINRPPPAVG